MNYGLTNGSFKVLGGIENGNRLVVAVIEESEPGGLSETGIERRGKTLPVGTGTVNAMQVCACGKCDLYRIECGRRWRDRAYQRSAKSWRAASRTLSVWSSIRAGTRPSK